MEEPSENFLPFILFFCHHQSAGLIVPGKAALPLAGDSSRAGCLQSPRLFQDPRCAEGAPGSGQGWPVPMVGLSMLNSPAAGCGVAQPKPSPTEIRFPCVMLTGLSSDDMKYICGKYTPHVISTVGEC